LPVEDYSDNDYGEWWDKSAAERDLCVNKHEIVIREPDADQMREWREKESARLAEEEASKPFADAEFDADESTSDWELPPELDFEKNPDHRPYMLPEDVPQDEDGWSIPMFKALEYGLRKFGTCWRRILSSKMGRKELCYLDQTDLKKKYQIEKKKNSTWGKWPHFYYYHGQKGKKSRKNRTGDFNPIAHVPGALPCGQRRPKPKKERIWDSGYEDVYWSAIKEGWVGRFKVWHGGPLKKLAKGRMNLRKRKTSPRAFPGNGRVTQVFTAAFTDPKDAHDELIRMKDERGLLAGEKFEKLMITMGLDPQTYTGERRLWLYKLSKAAGLVNYTVDEELLATPAPIKIYKFALYNFHKPAEVSFRP